MLNRSASPISREIARNCGGTNYSGRYAQQRRVRRRWQARPLLKRVGGNLLFESIQAPSSKVGDRREQTANFLSIYVRLPEIEGRSSLDPEGAL